MYCSPLQPSFSYNNESHINFWIYLEKIDRFSDLVVAGDVGASIGGFYGIFSSSVTTEEERFPDGSVLLLSSKRCVLYVLLGMYSIVQKFSNVSFETGAVYNIIR